MRHCQIGGDVKNPRNLKDSITPYAQAKNIFNGG